MKLLELTDMLRNENLKEYVDISMISRIENYEHIVEEYEDILVTDYILFFFKHVSTRKRLKDVKSTKGSLIFLKGGKDRTYVKETPDKIVEMLKNNQIIEIQGA